LQGDLASSQQDLFAATFQIFMGSLHAIAFSMDRKIWIITNRNLLTIGQTYVSDASLLVLHVSDQETCGEAVANSPTHLSAYAAKHRE